MTDNPISDPPPQEWPRTPLAEAVFENKPELVLQAVADGADPNACPVNSMSYLELATFHGHPLVVKALIDAGAQVPRDALRPLSEMNVTDYMIETVEEEQAYAEVARVLLDHGASADVKGYDGTDLISTFPLEFYPRIHRVLLGAAR